MCKSLVLKMLLLSCMILQSCVTTDLMWADSTYSESIENFLISSDGKQLVIIGEKYHYIFPTEKNLTSILISNKKKNIEPVFYDYKVQPDGIITGAYTLRYIYKNKTPENNKWLEQNGFTYSKKNINGQAIYIQSGTLQGKRYMANTSISSKHKFEKTYTLEIVEEATSLENTGKIAATPITVTTDGVIVIGVLTLIVVTHFVLNVTGNCNNPDFC